MSMSVSAFNTTPMDEKFINPQTKQGPVVFNGALHNALILRAKNAKAPYYPAATGAHFDNQSRVGRCDVVFTLLNSFACLSAMSNDGYGPKGDNHRVKAISVLNGLGVDSDDGNERLMDAIQPIGFAEVGYSGTNGSSNSQGYFNIIAGGTLTVLNNGKDVINVGDWVECYAPTKEEAEQGGQGTAADRNGERKLWLRSYDPHKNSLTPKPIFQCLNAVNGAQGKKASKSGFMPAYIRTCNTLMKSVKNMALVIMAATHKKIQKYAAGDKKQFLTNMMAAMKEDDELIRNMLFVPYSDSSNLIEQRMNKESPLNCAQMSAMGDWLVSTSVLQHHAQKNIMGKAVTTGRKQGNFVLQICSYSRK